MAVRSTSGGRSGGGWLELSGTVVNLKHGSYQSEIFREHGGQSHDRASFASSGDADENPSRGSADCRLGPTA
jgi:hypothetical protein